MQVSSKLKTGVEISFITPLFLFLIFLTSEVLYPTRPIMVEIPSIWFFLLLLATASMTTAWFIWRHSNDEVSNKLYSGYYFSWSIFLGSILLLVMATPPSYFPLITVFSVIGICSFALVILENQSEKRSVIEYNSVKNKNLFDVSVGIGVLLFTISFILYSIQFNNELVMKITLSGILISTVLIWAGKIKFIYTMIKRVIKSEPTNSHSSKK